MNIQIKNGALAVVRGTGKVLDFLNVASAKLYPLTRIPFVGETILDIQDLIAMLDDYYHGRYTKVPAVVIAGTAAIVAYLVSPLEVPILGVIDDALVIKIVLELCIDKELDRYRAWRDQSAAED